MDCDRVFTTLTRAPFPTGGSGDAAIERHLDACAACRRFAEALRPCDEVEHESLSGAQRRGLPLYRTARTPAKVVGRGGSHRETRATQVAASSRPWSPVRRYAKYDLAAPDSQVAAFTLAPHTRAVSRWPLAVALGASTVVGLGFAALVWLGV